MATKSGGQKWRPKVADKSGSQKWRPKVAAKSGGQKWWPKVAVKSGGQKWTLKVPQPLQNFIGPTIRIGREIRCLPYARFLLNRPLRRFSQRVAMSVCLSVCLSVCVCHRKTPTSRRRKNFWLNGELLILACIDIIFFFFFFQSMICCVFSTFLGFRSQPNVDNGGVSRGRVCGCGCWH